MIHRNRSPVSGIFTSYFETTSIFWCRRILTRGKLIRIISPQYCCRKEFIFNFKRLQYNWIWTSDWPMTNWLMTNWRSDLFIVLWAQRLCLIKRTYPTILIFYVWNSMNQIHRKATTGIQHCNNSVNEISFCDITCLWAG